MADFDQLCRWVKDDWEAGAKWREQAADDFAFLAGHQWTDEEKSKMEANQRVPIVFNRIAPILASVAGSEINNRTEVRFIPREMGDVKPNEVLSRGAEWFRDQANAEDEESIGFKDALTCGLGFTETSLDFESDAEGEPRIIRIEPCEMAWDAHARRKGLADSRRFHRVRRMPRDEAEEMFPGVDAADLSADWLDAAMDNPSVSRNEIGDEYKGPSERKLSGNADMVVIVQTQWRERVRVVEYVEPMTGQREEMTGAEWAKLEKAGLVTDASARKFWRHEWRQAFLGNVILKRNEPCKDASTFCAITGHWDSKDRLWFGLLRSMRDPQRYANKWLSTTLHIIASNAKGGIWAKRGAVENEREFEESWSATDAVSWLDRSAVWGQDIGEKPKADMPAALMGLTEFAISSIRDVSGVNLELLGMREANQPGILEYQRRQSALTTLAEYFDSLRYYRKNNGVVLMYFLRDHIAPTGRLVRIMEDGMERYVPLALADDARKYDVIVDEAAQAPNQKEKNWSIIEAMLPMFAERMDAEDWVLVAEHSPLPSAFVDHFKKKLETQKQQGPDPMQQLAQAQMQAAVKKDEGAAALNMAKAQQAQADAQVAPLLAQADAMQAQADILRAQAELRYAPERMAIERMQAMADIDASRAGVEKTRMDTRLAPAGMAAKMRPPGAARDGA